MKTFFSMGNWLLNTDQQTTGWFLVFITKQLEREQLVLGAEKNKSSEGQFRGKKHKVNEGQEAWLSGWDSGKW